MLHQALVIHQDISIKTILSNSGIGQILQDNPTCAPSLHEAKNTHSRFNISSFSVERDMMCDSYSLHSLMSSFAALDAPLDNIWTANSYRETKVKFVCFITYLPTNERNRGKTCRTPQSHGQGFALTILYPLKAPWKCGFWLVSLMFCARCCFVFACTEQLDRDLPCFSFFFMLLPRQQSGGTRHTRTAEEIEKIEVRRRPKNT